MREEYTVRLFGYPALLRDEMGKCSIGGSCLCSLLFSDFSIDQGNGYALLLGEDVARNTGVHVVSNRSGCYSLWSALC